MTEPSKSVKLPEIQRYSVFRDSQDREDPCPYSTGKWVLYSEHSAQLAASEASRALLLEACKQVVEICEEGDTGASFGRVVSAMNTCRAAIKAAQEVA